MTLPFLNNPQTPWQYYSRQKIVPKDSLESFGQHIRQTGKTLATLNGSFDVLHAGHMHILYEASLQADILLVALNSDSSIQSYKGTDRPIIPLQYRIELMTALACVDYVTWFDETDPRLFLQKIKPDVHVNGIEYGLDCIEAGTLKEIGARLHLVNRLPGLATSEMIRKIQTLPSSSPIPQATPALL